MRAHFALHVLAEAGAAVVHRQQHPGHRQARVQLALHERQRLEQSGEPLQREVLGLHRHDHAVGGDERATVSGPSDGGQSSRM